jgi:hypothetical protein
MEGDSFTLRFEKYEIEADEIRLYDSTYQKSGLAFLFVTNVAAIVPTEPQPAPQSIYYNKAIEVEIRLRNPLAKVFTVSAHTFPVEEAAVIFYWRTSPNPEIKRPITSV